jgi:hypothetical protein
MINCTNGCQLYCCAVSVAEPIGALLLSEGISGQQNSGGSTSSRSDGSEYDIVPKSYSSTPRNFPSRRSFLSKPIHPLSFPEHALEGQETDSPVANASTSSPMPSEFKAIGEIRPSGLMDYAYASGSHGESANWSAASSMDLTDLSERHDAERSGPLRSNNIMDRTRCDLCERLLSKRSPWGSRRIVRTGDLPVAGVLPCCHVYHAECLERTTPKGQKHDPPCPACDRLSGKDTEQWSICRLRNGFPSFVALESPRALNRRDAAAETRKVSALAPSSSRGGRDTCGALWARAEIIIGQLHSYSLDPSPD